MQFRFIAKQMQNADRKVRKIHHVRNAWQELPQKLNRGNYYPYCYPNNVKSP